MATGISERPSPSPLAYRADIDGLRAIAVLVVVGFHAFPAQVGGGFVGVDVFFVISGYLISGIIFRGLESGGFSYRHFYARRIRRIFPALLPVLLACLVAGSFICVGEEYGQLGAHIAAGAGFASNFLAWHESGYFDESAELKPLLHLWSLGIEEQFYLVWPLLLGICWKCRWNFLGFAALIAAASFAAYIYTTGSDPVAAFYSPLTRAWELMLGSMLAYRALHAGEASFRAEQWWSWPGLALVALSAALLHSNLAYPGWYALLPCAGTLLIVSAGPSAWFNRKLLSNPVLVKIGLISYPLYLWHWPLLSFAHIMESRMPSVGLRAGLVLVSVFLAACTYDVIEKHLRFGKDRALKIVALCLSMALIGCGGYVVSRQPSSADIVFDFLFTKPADIKNIRDPALRGYETLLRTQRGYILGLIESSHSARREWDCNIEPRQSPDVFRTTSSHCLTLSADKKNVLIMGDSHAADLYVALSRTHGQYNFLQLTGDWCVPMTASALGGNEALERHCAGILQEAVHFAQSNRLDAMILAGRWYRDYNLTALTGTLKATGARVILVGPPLEYTAYTSKIIARRSSDKGLERYVDSFAIKGNVALSEEMREFARVNGISFIDRIAYFCGGSCPVLSPDGQLLIYDYGHLSIPGALYLGNRLLSDNVLQKIMGSPVPMQLPERNALKN